MKIELLCAQIRDGADGAKLVDFAATSGEANKDFAKGTPAANLTLEVSNSDALTFFQEGHTYSFEATDLGRQSRKAAEAAAADGQ